MDVRELIRTIPDYPKAGIMFRDITTLLKDPHGSRFIVDHLADRYRAKDVDYIVGIEARGFILGAALAYKLGIGFIPIRKKGKLPGPTIEHEYQLEYGSDVMEIHDDAIPKGSRVVVHDDLLATGGTALGAVKLIEKIGGQVEELCFIVDLPDLRGGEKIKQQGHQYYSICEFEGE